MGNGANNNPRLERFAEAIAFHEAEKGNPGGDLTIVAYKLKISIGEAQAMLLKLRRDLGPQAK